MKRTETFAAGLQLVVAFMITGVLLRAYEYLLVSANFALPGNTLTLYLNGLGFDILYYSGIGAFFWILFVALSFLHRRAARVIISLLMILVLILDILFIQYFAELLIPLGSDLFAYNLTEVQDTIHTSIQITIWRTLPLILIPGLFLLFCFLFRSSGWESSWTNGGVALLFLLAVCFLLFTPGEDRYEHELDYSLTTNKSAHFWSSLWRDLISGWSQLGYSGQDYPLLTESDTVDSIGGYFHEFDRPPNLVFIVVESLGGIVMPPHADYGGFTPFLDSLAAESLYWTHFLSTSGRSFNAMPSIFGSLPYGERGFMEMGFRAPAHHTLISILNDNGYHTAYFCGYESRFDNLDQFLERQQIDLLMDASRFTDDYSKMDEIEGGFTWGYSDKATFQRAFEFLDGFDSQMPRLDIYFTLNFHEPFIIDEQEYYRQLFYERLAELEPASSGREEYLRYADIFTALLYTDDAIRDLMNRYRMREDYDDTIFVITGDHRMIPVPHRNRIDRYHVPFLIYSSRLRELAIFEGVSSHLDVTPSVLAYLENEGHVQLPDSAHWLGGSLSVSDTFETGRSIPLMRNKNQMLDYLSGRGFLSGNQLFELERGMNLRPSEDEEWLLEVSLEFEEFRQVNRYVTAQNRIMRSEEPDRSVDDESGEYVRSIIQEVRHLTNEEQFSRARELAFVGEYADARAILRRVLQENPNFHDARLLLGRTYGWDGEYEQAEALYNDVLRRNPELLDVYEAIADLFFWMDDPDRTLDILNRGLTIHQNSVSLLFRKARAHQQLGNLSEARRILNEALEIAPDYEQLQLLREQLLAAES